MFDNSPCLFVVCTSNGVHFYLPLPLRETEFVVCFNEAIKNFNRETPLLLLYVSLSLPLSELHCDIGYMAAYFDVGFFFCFCAYELIR